MRDSRAAAAAVAFAAFVGIVACALVAWRVAAAQPRDGSATAAATAARHATASPEGGGGPLPGRWDWRRVDEADARAHARATGGPPPRPGRYASDAVNQHAGAYCGCCFLVATLQCVQDRYNIARAADVAIGDDFRVHHFDLQAAVDEYSAAHAADQRRVEAAGVRVAAAAGGAGGAAAAWNACMGGDPVEVGRALADDALRLRRAHPWSQWSSRACETTPRLPAALREFPVAAVRVLDQDDVASLKRAVLRGPVVVGVRAAGLWALREGGVPEECHASGGADRDHVVSVVGWTRRAGAEFWVARNSWGDGDGSLVFSRPADVRQCTPRCEATPQTQGGGGGAPPSSCASAPVAWHNRAAHAPGMVLLPADPAQNCLGIYDAPSGWVEVHV